MEVSGGVRGVCCSRQMQERTQRERERERVRWEWGVNRSKKSRKFHAPGVIKQVRKEMKTKNYVRRAVIATRTRFVARRVRWTIVAGRTRVDAGRARRAVVPDLVIYIQV